ncbi:NTP pyrophosphohydrolase [Microbacterium sp.]|uniref:NTP pyrophosphohydrolase n=1 Tax=Microbacterium sp. TaxID=51671 RepID=UPI003341CC06
MSGTLADVAVPADRLASAHARGAVRVRERVIDKVVRAAAADAIGVARDDIDVEVSEWARGLAIRVAGPAPVPDLDDREAVEAAEPMLERMGRLQRILAAELARLTGREIRRISVTVTGARIPERKRVM